MFNRALMSSRLPLGEISSSTFNKIKHSTNDKISNVPAISSAVTLPSNMESPTNRILFNSLNSRLKRGKLISRNDSKTVNSTTSSTNKLKFSDTEIKDFSQLSHKLQIRLQFAYYKYKTEQSNLKFADLKNKFNGSDNKTYKDQSNTKIKLMNANLSSENHGIAKSHPKIKRRKLVVSHGQYKSPMKRRMPEKVAADPNTRINPNSNNLLNKLSEKSDAENTITEVSEKTSVTPIRRNKFLKHNIYNSHIAANTSVAKQETPMKVDAAKSLIDLLSSKNF